VDVEAHGHPGRSLTLRREGDVQVDLGPLDALETAFGLRLPTRRRGTGCSAHAPTGKSQPDARWDEDLVDLQA
jgi:hypothetical protein